jgi:hypothetical protein
MKEITNIPAPFNCPCNVSSHHHGTRVCGRDVFSKDGDSCQKCLAEESLAGRQQAQTNSSNYDLKTADQPNLKDQV